MSIYKERGHTDRRDYLESLADEYGLALDIVLSLADLLGPSEDFDGLLCALADAESYL